MSKLIAAVVISAAALAGAAPAVAAGPLRCNTITALNAMTCPPVNGNTGNR